ncbi:Endoplasmic reticulum metallopeptidase 1 [Cichlidogyrus casuarinus]|uniref:Endoplasmic reticulum metallopeptidase 1 n=1 Tax=Cichlidogyrus casuarinus TaxID=1844966 RepID=A0ABD2QBK1_9PLAT
MEMNSSCSNQLPRSHIHNFSTFNARKILNDVTSFGSRTAGSIANEVYTREYILQKLNEIKSSASSAMEIQLSEQLSNISSFRSHNHVTTYTNLLNLVLRIHDKRVTSPLNHALLVNCHYDTPVNTPGASDVFISCAVMIETARVLASGQFSLHHDIIMLFNGAEESILPASHAFVEQHPWSRDAIAFINLEGAGAGGRQVVFQTGPGSSCQIFMNAFTRSAQNPLANVIGEELFQSGIIPADTDFRIFRDYGHIPGIDMAYISDGYAYHTEHDVASRVSDDCIALAGNNLVDLVIELVNSADFDSIPRLPHLNTLPTDVYNSDFSIEQPIPHFIEPDRNPQIDASQRYIYFDYLGLFIVYYPLWFNNVLVYLSLFLIVLFVKRNHRRDVSHWKAVLFATVIHLICFLLMFAFTVALGFFNHLTGLRLSWYSARWNILIVYLLPMTCFYIFLSTKVFAIRDRYLTNIFIHLVFLFSYLSGIIVKSTVQEMPIKILIAIFKIGKILTKVNQNDFFRFLQFHTIH